MRILAAHPGPDRYGADLMLLAALRGLQSAGADVTVAVGGTGPLVEDLRSAGLATITTPFPVLRKSLLRPASIAGLLSSMPGSVRRLVRLIRDCDADVVYVNTVTIPHWILAARVARRPVVCHVREAEDTPPMVVQRAITAPLLLCSRTVTNSEHTRRYVVHRWPRLDSRTVVVHNGFRFPPTPPPPAGAIEEMLLVGRLSPRKGQDVAVRALGLLHDWGHRLHLRLVGTAFPGYEWYVADLERLVSELGLEDHVSFDGYRADTEACNAAADIVVVPSRIEPFGNVAVEALSANRPVVASDVGGLREIITDGDTGRLVPPDDPRALAEAVTGLLSDPAEATAMAERGARRVRDQFSLERYVRNLNEVLLSTSRSSAGRTT